MSSNRVALVGLDSLTPVMTERFRAEGRMPNLERMRARGWYSEITPTLPATTPAGWSTVATGAWPSTHGVEGFAIHREGDPLDKKTHALTSDRIKAELIWNTAERAGKRVILLKYPMSWPPTGGAGVVQVDGAGGWGGLKCVWDLAHSGCWDTHQPSPPGTTEIAESVGVSDWQTRDHDNLDEESVQPLHVESPGCWTNLPAGMQPVWETRLVVGGSGATPGPIFHALAGRLGGEDRVLLGQQRDGRAAHVLARSEWSEYFKVVVPTAGSERSGHLRFKVMELDIAAGRLRLYQTQVHSNSGYTRPASVGDDLLLAAGPFVEWTESYDLLQGWIDHETQLEIYRQHVDWMISAARTLLREHPWDLFMTQVHFLDMAYHVYWGAVDPRHPHYDAARAPYFWDLLGRVHELADAFVGAIQDEIGPDAVTMVLGEHGQDVYHTTLLANHLLVREGLLKLCRDRRTGQARIDWSRSRAYASSYRVYLNVAGRDPHGTIPVEEYAATQDRVIRALYQVRDPRTGDAPVRLAMRREDAVSLGLYGPTMGDVVFAMAPGFQTRSTIGLPAGSWTGGQLAAERLPLLQSTELFREFTGEHDTALPFTRAIHSELFMSGPGVRHSSSPVPTRLVDIAPSICAHLGIPTPANCEGQTAIRCEQGD